MITPEAWTPVIINNQCSSIKWIERSTEYVLPRIQVFIYIYIYSPHFNFFAVINQLGVYRLLYCLVYSYRPIHSNFLLLKFSTVPRFNYIYTFVTTFRFFNKSLEEERLDRSKYRVYSSRFVFAVFLWQFIRLSWPYAYKISKYF